MRKYDDKFYKNRNRYTKISSMVVLQALKNVWEGEIHSVIDMGCGVGVWLNSMQEIYEDVTVHGVDGAYVNKDYLVIPSECFEEWNLEDEYYETHKEKYDVAITLEVAEHLCSQRAESFVKDLVSMADIILFSAAIPYQKILGGAVSHINEQPLSYWMKKFDAYGYKMYDLIRPQIWNNEHVLSHYKQNIVLFIKKGSKAETKIINKEFDPIIDIVHPESLGIIGKMLDGRLGKLFLILENKLIEMRKFLKIG